MDILFITYATGGCTDNGGLVRKRPHLLQSEACYKWSEKRESCVLSVTLNYITEVCMCRKKGQEAVTGPEGAPSRK